MEQIPFAILTLIFISAALSAIFFFAWRTFGRMAHALTWAIMFLLSSFHWVLNLFVGLDYAPLPALQTGLQFFLGPATTFLSVIGYMQRAQRTVTAPLFTGLILVTWGLNMWFYYVSPHEGIRASILPFVIVASNFWSMWVLYDEPRPKRLVEWAIIGCQGLFAISQMVVGSIALSQGATPDPAAQALYVSITFLTLPTFFTLSGMFALSLIASDISTRAEVLAEYQKRKRKEEAEKSWGTIQDAIEAIPDLIAIDDGNGNFMTCNEALANFIEKKREDLAGQRTMNMIALYRNHFAMIDGAKVRSAEDVAQKLWHALTTGTRLDVLTNDGRSYLVDCGYLRSGGNIMIARDVTQLNNARERLESAISAMPIGFALFDRERQLVACNKSYENLLQQDQDWIGKQSVSTLISTFQRRLKGARQASLVERSEWLHEWLEAVEAGREQRGTVLLDDDSWYDISNRPVPGEGFVTIANDVTQRRLLEIDLEKNEAQLRQILGGQPFPVMLVRSEDDKILFASAAAADALQGEEHHIVGKKAEDFFGEQHRDLGSTSTDNNLAQTGAREATLRPLAGDPLPILVSGHDIVYAGQPSKVISFLDISNIKDLQSELANQREALFQSEKLNALGTLLAGVAHELNNPLTVVVANAHVLAMSSKDEAANERIEKITDAADRCAKIIRSFLDMARKSPGEKVAFDPVSCVRQAIDLSLYGLQEDKIEVRENIPDELPAVKGDPDQLAQVVLNLIINAKHALLECDRPGKIDVSMQKADSGKFIELHVVDNGNGVPANVRDNIFDPFFTTKKVGEGTGMGLSLVRGIVQSHGGTIELVQNGFRGAHFKVTLPHIGYHLPSVISRRVVQKREPKQNILIVDDEPNVLAVLEDILVLQGHDVSAVSSAAEALDALEENEFDGMISDIRMPEMDGMELFDAIKKKYPDMVDHIAFITGNDLSENTKSFLDTCNRPYLGKPFIPEEVADLMQELRREETPN